MRTTLIPTPDGAALILDEALCDALGVTAGSEVEVSTNGDVLVITPLRDESRRERFEQAMRNIDAKYAGVFRRLADS